MNMQLICWSSGGTFLFWFLLLLDDREQVLEVSMAEFLGLVN